VKLYAKIGTHPAGYVDLPRKRKEPKVGDRIAWLEAKNGKLQTGVVDEIRDVLGQRLFFVARM